MNTTWIPRNATELQFKEKSSIGWMEHDGPVCYWEMSREGRISKK